MGTAEAKQSRMLDTKACMLALSLLSTSGRLGCQSYLQQQNPASQRLHDMLKLVPQQVIMALTGQRVLCSPLPIPAAQQNQ